MGAIGLIVALFAAAIVSKKFTWKTLGGTLLVFCVVIALAVPAIDKFSDPRNERLFADLRLEYLSLCAGINRSFILRQAHDVAEVAVWPAQGPRDGAGDDLFFRSKNTSQDWLRGREGGRYGGFRNVVLLSPSESKERSAPRYHVIIDDLGAEIRHGRDYITGVRTRIIDRNTNEVIADRRDYAGKAGFGFAGGCDAMQSGELGQWSLGNLEFIHKVLNPPAGVQIIKKYLPMLLDSRIKKLAPKSTLAKLVDEGGSAQVEKPAWENLPPEIRYRPEYRTTPSGAALHDYALGFLLKDRDIWISQGLGASGSLLALSKDAREYVALFWIDSQEHLLLRRFSFKGELLGQERVVFPKSIRPVAYANSPDKHLRIEPSRYRIALSINASNGNFEKNIELLIPRTKRAEKTTID